MVSFNTISQPRSETASIIPAALVTGAASGIGREFAVALAARSNNLVLVDRSGRSLHEVARDLNSRYRVKAEPVVADLAKPSTPIMLLKHCWKNRLRIMTLINCAGVGVRQPMARQSLDSIRQEIDVNVTAAAQLIRVFLPPMLRRRSGMIINIASVAAFQRMPSMAVYGGSKSFLSSVTESLATELEGTGVHVALVCPGVTKTPFLNKLGLDPSEVPSNAQTPEEVVEEALAAIERKQELIVTGFSNRVRVWSEILTPHRVARAAKHSLRRLLGLI